MEPCFECGAPAEYDHHVVPRSKGGVHTVPLCAACHGKAHDRRMNTKSLTKAALGAKKARGERVGEIPYGYRLATDGVHLEPDQAEQAVIAEA